MGNVVGADSGKGSVNVELNIVPFIDLMSCLTAFLLVAAVWVSIAQIDAHSAGSKRDSIGDNADPKLSVLVESDGLWIGVSRVNDFTHLPNTPLGYDWPGLEAQLRVQKASALFEKTTALELAADSSAAHPVQYQQLVAAMDVAVKAGFTDVGITAPNELSAQPRL
jgi:biopolymer transport protein ExbD